MRRLSQAKEDLKENDKIVNERDQIFSLTLSLPNPGRILCIASGEAEK
jgi:hypothetical protein